MIGNLTKEKKTHFLDELYLTTGLLSSLMVGKILLRTSTASSPTTTLINLVHSTWLLLKRDYCRFNWIWISMSHLTSTTWITGLFYKMQVSLPWSVHFYAIHLLLIVLYNLTEEQYIWYKASWRRKHNKKRLTLNGRCNTDGSDELPFLVIGKYGNPHCFKNVNRYIFGWKYRSNR